MAEHDEQESDIGFRYDVFLSFRGEDTREKFIGHLRKALSRKGIITFIDDKNLEMGESISPALSKAIAESSVFIVVFSENYASSTWCLDELVEILDRSKNGNNKQRVFPIFYHVDPLDIRYQINRYGEHMISHENKFGKDSQRVKNWRSALTEASSFPGGKHFTSGSQEYEIKLIEELVDTVYKNIAPKSLHTGQNPIGLGARLEEVKSLLDMNPHDKTVSMLGIYGLRGIGKTELAKALYDEIVQEFDSACFLADVSEKSNKINGLEDLQKTLLSKMSGDLETRLSSTSKGMREIKRKLCQKKVLLVLDDVDDKDRLEKLAGGRDWFGLGSRIIITTSDKGVLIAHKVEKYYEMKELDQQLSLELFCWNVFKQSHPKIGFDNVSLRAVGFAKGLPSAIKVIASDLANLPEESLDDWECVLEEYERNPPNKRILDVLKINYDRLGCNAKQVFLDIACFFNGERIEYVKKILEEFGASNIDVLVNKSLLSIENDCLKMRDLIQDMGREIVRQETSKLGKRSRLWHYEDVIEVLTEDYGSDIDNIQGIMLDPPEQVKVTWDGTAFEKMKWLRILIIRNTLFSCEPKHLPNHLRVLEWEEYPSKSLPSKFHPKNIIIFNLPRAHLTLEAPFEDFSEFLFIQKVDARHTSLSTFTADMLWLQAAKGTRELEIVMPKTEIPEWFDFIGNGENPCFWVRGKFPTFSLALVFHGVAGSCERQGDHHQILQLQLVINGRCVSRSDYKFRIAADHVLICDLRILFSDEEWLGLDAFLLHDDYNVVQVSYQAPASLMLSQWGVHVSDEGANMEDVQFVCPNSKYLVVPTKEDPKEEPKELVENLGTDTASENIDYCENMKDSIGEIMKALLYSVIGPSSDSEDIDPFLMAIFLTEYYASTPSLLEETKDHQKEKRRKIFSDGIRDGLVQIKNNFPSLDIVKTRSVALMKGSKVRWISEEIPEVVKMYIGGIISGLSEAKLSFPNLDMDGTLSPMLHKIGMKGLNDRFGQPRLEVIEELNMDYGLQPLTRHIYHDGIMDGLYEAQKSFPSLDIVETKRVALSKMASHSKLYLGEDVAQVLPTVEIRIYTDGILGGLLEAKQSFPDLDIITTVTTVLCKMGIIEAYYVDHETEDFHQMNLALKRVKDKGKGLIMDVGEASSSNHQESDEKQGNNPQKEEVMREIFREGITDGLVNAQNKFPSLDIDKTRIAALNKKIYDHKAVWSFPEPEDGHPPPSLEMKTYIEGIMNGLLEAKLSFPQLDIWATLDTLNSQRFKASIVSLPVVPVLDWTKVIPPPPGSHDNPLMEKSTIMKQQSSKSEAEANKSPQKLMEEHEALHNKFVQVENENVVPNKNSDIDNICEYDESIQKFNTQLEEFVSKKLNCTSGSRILTDKGCKCETKYEKASTLLKEWAEELGMLYDTGIEVFQNSEKFQDLMNVIYLNGLKDGFLEAETVLHAQDMNTKTQLSKENEEHVIC